MWKWTWEDAADFEADGDTDDTFEEDSEDESCVNNQSGHEQFQSHYVTFKCVGVTKTTLSQEVLAESAIKLKRTFGSTFETRTY